MEIERIKLGKGVALGIRIPVGKAPVLIIKADKGFVMCGYLNVEAANKMGDAAAKVSGVNSFDDVLDAEIKECTDAARALGVEPGMNGRAALEKMF
jgi:uncharacterized protein YunC (DUF1805 family)